MSTRHKPDHEVQLTLRVLRELAALPPAGRQRVLAYWSARAPDMPREGSNQHGEQQLDITDVTPSPLHVGGAAGGGGMIAAKEATVPQLIDGDRIAELLQVSRRTLDRLVHDGEFPKPLRIGGAARWRASDYAAYVERLAARQAKRGR